MDSIERDLRTYGGTIAGGGLAPVLTAFVSSTRPRI